MVQTRNAKKSIQGPDSILGLIGVDVIVEKFAWDIFQQLEVIKLNCGSELIEGMVSHVTSVLSSLNEKLAVIKDLEYRMHDMESENSLIIDKLRHENKRLCVFLDESFDREIKGEAILQTNQDLVDEIKY